MSSGRNGKLSAGTVSILKSGVILNLNLSAVLGEVKHSYHALGSLAVFCIHSLGIYENLSNLIAMVSGLLGNDNVVGIRVTADNHRDVGMLREELIPKIVSGVIVGVVRSSVSGFASDAESSVTLHIVVSSNDYLMIGMSGNNLVCPHENIILGSVVKAKKEIINGSRLEGVVNVIYSSLLIVSGDVLCISCVITEILIKEFDTVVTVTADK